MTGLAYLLVPGLALAVVGVESATTTDFLLRTEGVALVCAALFIWAARDGSTRQVHLVLVGLAVYYILGSLVDLAAFAQGIVGVASVPSAAVRIALGGLCLIAAARLSRSSAIS